MYHIDPDHFWNLFSGRKVTICWSSDGTTTSRASVLRTGFESWEPQPLRDTVDNIYGVYSQTCGAFTSALPYLPGRQTRETHLGIKALRYGGLADSYSVDRGSLCYFRVFDINLYIRPGTWLIYWIYPTSDSPLNKYIGLDLLCTDGTRLKDSGAVDTRGASMHPADGHIEPFYGSPTIFNGQWNQIKCNVGRWLAGKIVDKIYLSFEVPSHLWGTPWGQGRGYFSGNIDTIYLGHTPGGQLGNVGLTTITR